MILFYKTRMLYPLGVIGFRLANDLIHFLEDVGGKEGQNLQGLEIFLKLLNAGGAGDDAGDMLIAGTPGDGETSAMWSRAAWPACRVS